MILLTPIRWSLIYVLRLLGGNFFILTQDATCEPSSVPLPLFFFFFCFLILGGLHICRVAHCIKISFGFPIPEGLVLGRHGA